MYLFLLVGAIVLMSLFVAAYFSLLNLRKKRDQAFSAMNLNMKKRYEYVDDLIELLEEYPVNDISMDIVIQACDMARQSKNLNQKEHNENILGSCLEDFFKKLDYSIDLKKDKQYIDAKIRMELLDKQILKSRKQYNDIVEHYNRIIGMFPLSVLAFILKMKKFPIFIQNKV